MSNIIAIAAGAERTLVLLNDGTVIGGSDTPAGLSNVVAVANGGGHSLVLFSDGTVRTWGSYYFGDPQGLPPPEVTNVVAIACGQDHSLALRNDGKVIGWGAGLYQYGVEPNLGQSWPPLGFRNAIGITASRWRSAALYTVNPRPFNLTDSRWDPADGFSVSFQGEAWQSYQIQVSDNLIDWIDALEICSPDGQFNLYDPDAVHYPKTFYRGMARNYPVIAP